MINRANRADWLAVGVLLLLWSLFFWRVLTPIDADKASFKHGDFSGQFVTFGAYQYERFNDGEIPLWNPYNNSGLPFIADTQAAVFYPPRLLTIALASFTSGWQYHTLELEAIFHVLGYTLAMYALVRRPTGHILSGVIAAIVGGYGGYLSGYPPLQLALLEAGVWLPLALLGIHDATEGDSVRPLPLTLTGAALGLSWLAGHPQTSWFLTYLSVAYFAYRCWHHADHWRGWLRRLVWGTALFGIITVGATAITFLPGIEYLAQTARAGFGFAVKGNGFPFQDVLQFVYPGVVSLFSPLYVGLATLPLIFAAAHGPRRAIVFWFWVAIVGLLLSFGANTALFAALYNTLPGLRFFRGQERAAYLVANSLAILAGYGLHTLITTEAFRERLRRVLPVTAAILVAAFALIAILWRGFPDAFGALVGPAAFALLVALALWAIGRWLAAHPAGLAPVALVVLIAFELFSVNMDAASNYDDIPPADQINMSAPPLIAPVVHQPNKQPARVDGFRGLTDNYGSLYGALDARGISPLFLDGLYQLQQPPFASESNFETNPTYWELAAVRYVYSGFEALPVESRILASGADRFGPVNLHELADPRPFAHLIYRADVVDSDAFARALLADPRFSPRASVILHTPPPLDLPDAVPESASAIVTAFAPERFTVQVETPENAILSLAHPDYPGWQAALNGEPAPILRAYGGFSAVAVPEGTHEITFTYRPLSFIIGAIMSAITWAALGLTGLWAIVRKGD